jgi:hypothetical protein
VDFVIQNTSHTLRIIFWSVACLLLLYLLHYFKQAVFSKILFGTFLIIRWNHLGLSWNTRHVCLISTELHISPQISEKYSKIKLYDIRLIESELLQSEKQIWRNKYLHFGILWTRLLLWLGLLVSCYRNFSFKSWNESAIQV